MTEKDFADRIRQRLEQGSRQIDGIALRRLEEARHQALARVRSAEHEVMLASRASGQQGQGALRLHGSGSGRHQHPMRLLFVGLAVMALMAGTVYWQQANEDDGNEEGLLDAKMLSSELPLYTFLHPDFKEWVNSSR
jgi:hypothetical protein